MPFIKKNDAKTPPVVNGAQRIFVGRAHELRFFTEEILQPVDPAYNIISIYGDGGVGKSTLLARYREEAATAPYKSYCMTATVNELQANPESMMERFAEQLHMGGAFKHALASYKVALRKQQEEQETMQDAVLQHASDIAGATVEGVPFVGPLLREGAKIAVGQVVNRYRAGQARRGVEHLEDPISDLTRAFVTELNRLADTRVNVPEQGLKRQHRIVLIFDTFEQLAVEAAPWLLDQFLTLRINSDIVIMSAGRIPIERSIPNDPKRWLEYLDSGVIYPMNLNNFTEQETRDFLAQRGISDPEHIRRIWQLSRGLPLYLSLLTSGPERDVDPTADVVDNFLRWIPERDELRRRLVLDAALFSRPFNQDDLAAFSYIPEQQRLSLARWLIRQSFVHTSLQDGRYSYHELAEDLFSRHLYRSSPASYHAARRMLADYYHGELSTLQAQGGREMYNMDEWIDLSLALAQQLLLLPDEQSHLKAVEQLLNAYYRTKQEEEITRVLREVTTDRPYNPAGINAKHLAKLLLRYLEAEPLSADFLAAADALLDRVAALPAFASDLLARIYATRGVTYRNFNDYQQAIEDFERAIELYPTYAWAYGNRGITYRAQHQYDRALVDFNSALKLDETMDWIYSARGEVHRHLHNYPQSLADFGRAIELDPDYAQAYAGRGRVSIRLGHYEEALADLNRAIALDNEQSWFYAQRGEAQRYLRQYEEALIDLTQAITLNPGYFWAYASRGLVYFFLHDYDHAVQDYNQALEFNPDYDWAYAERGRTYHHRKEYAQAIADFDRAIALTPRYAWTYSHRGLSYAALREYQMALQDFDTAIAITPSYGRAYGRRGSAYLALGELERARADFARNYELAPSDLWAGWMSEWVGMCLQRADAETVGRLEAIAAQQPSNYTALVCSAVALWLPVWLGQVPEEEQAVRVERALARLEEARTQRPTWWDAYFWRGLLLSSQGLAEGVEALTHAWDAALPPALRAPLYWLEERQPAWYQQYLVPFLSLNI